MQYLSPSSVRGYSQCPYAYKAMRESGVDIAGPDANFGRWIHKSIEMAIREGRDVMSMSKEIFVQYGMDIDYFAKGQQMLERLKKRSDYFTAKVLLVEEDVYVVLKNGVGIHGILDVIFDRGRRTMEVVDWKTGGKPLPPNYLRHDIQMAIYELLARHRFPERPNVILTVDALQYEPQTVEGTAIDDKTLHDYLQVVYNAIYVDREFRPRYNRGCGRCAFNSKCPLMQKMDEKGMSLTYRLGQHDDKDVAEEYIRFYAMKRVCESRCERAREYFENALGDKDYATYDWGSVKKSQRGISIALNNPLKKNGGKG